MAVVRSEQYAWNDITLSVGGRILYQATKIEVEYGYEHETGFAKGGFGQFINEKNFTVSGSLELLQSEVEALEESYGKDLQRTYFDITWTFDARGDLNLRTHVVKHFKFGKIKKALGNSDAFMKVSIPFMALDIDLNV